MPPHLQRGIVKLSLIAILKVEYKRTQRRISNKFVIGVILLLITTLIVYIISFRLIEDHPSEIAEGCRTEMLTYLLHQWAML